MPTVAQKDAAKAGAAGADGRTVQRARKRKTSQHPGTQTRTARPTSAATKQTGQIHQRMLRIVQTGIIVVASAAMAARMPNSAAAAAGVAMRTPLSHPTEKANRLSLM